MNELKFLEIIGKIDESLVKEADRAVLRSAEQDVSGNADSVSGVEGYRRSRWSRTAAAAAVFLVIAGAGLGGAALLKRHGAPSADSIEEGETVTVSPASAAEEKTEQAVTEIVSEKKETAEAVSDVSERETMNAEDMEEAASGTDLSSESSETGNVSQETSEPAEEKINTTEAAEPVTSNAIQYETTTKAETPTADNERAQMFARIESLDYIPITCDGLPDYKLISDDGKVYWLNIDGRWIWKNGIDAEAVLPEDIALWLLDNEGSINMQKTRYYRDAHGEQDMDENDGEQPATWIYRRD